MPRGRAAQRHSATPPARFACRRLASKKGIVQKTKAKPDGQHAFRARKLRNQAENTHFIATRWLRSSDLTMPSEAVSHAGDLRLVRHLAVPAYVIIIYRSTLIHSNAIADSDGFCTSVLSYDMICVCYICRCPLAAHLELHRLFALPAQVLPQPCKAPCLA